MTRAPHVKNCRSLFYFEEPDKDVFVGRPSKYGNPFVIGVDGSRSQVIRKYRDWFFSNHALMKEARQELEGKNLVCYCAPEDCHADILLEFVNSADLSV